MPTLHSSTHDSHELRMRLGSRLVALCAPIAIGTVALIIALAGAHRVGTAKAAIHSAQTRAHARSVAVVPAGFDGFSQDPTTLPAQRVRTVERNGWPSLASVLAPLTAQQRRYVLGIASLSEAQIAAAFGTGT